MTRLQGIFVENLKNERKKAGLTQESLAEKADITQKYYGTIERGIKFPSLEILENISNALAIAPYRLFIESISMADSLPEEMIDNYNSFLEKFLKAELPQAGKKFLSEQH